VWSGHHIGVVECGYRQPARLLWSARGRERPAFDIGHRGVLTWPDGSTITVPTSSTDRKRISQPGNPRT